MAVRVAGSGALIRLAVFAKLVCAFAFAGIRRARFSQDAAHIILVETSCMYQFLPVHRYIKL